MPVILKGSEYLRTHEALKRAGISRATFFRWLKKGVIIDSFQKDRRGWRLFTEEDIASIRKEVEKTYMNSRSQAAAFDHEEAK